MSVQLSGMPIKTLEECPVVRVEERPVDIEGAVLDRDRDLPDGVPDRIAEDVQGQDRIPRYRGRSGEDPVVHS